MKKLTDRQFLANIYQDAILHCSLFKGILRDDIYAMLYSLESEFLQYDSNEMIIAESQKTDSIGILLSGKVATFSNDLYGNPHLEKILTDSDTFNLAYSSLTSQPVIYSLVCQQETTVLFIHLSHLADSHNFTHYHRLLTMNLLQIISEGYISYSQHLMVLSQPTSREKILCYLNIERKKNHANRFVIPFDRFQLSEYLGIERSCLSNELSKLQKEGIIYTHRHHFEILINPEAQN